MYSILLASALVLLPALPQERPDSASPVNVAVWRELLAGLRKYASLDSTSSVCVGISSADVGADHLGISRDRIQPPPTWIPDSLRHLADAHISSTCLYSLGQGIRDSAGHGAVLIVAGPVERLSSDSAATSGAYLYDGSLGNFTFILARRDGRWAVVSQHGIYVDG